jgi:MFS family permease
MSVQNLQWVPSGYLLTYGGFMLLGGRAADLLGRRRVLVAGTFLFGASALAGGLASDSGVVIGSRMAQGIGAAMMLPAALSILTTTFTDGPERHKALGAWGGMAGLGSAAGVLLGGLLTQGLGWRWVFLIKPPLCAIVLVGAFAFIPNDRRRARLANFDILGALLATAGALLLVYALVRAPAVGWSSARTIGELASAAALLAVFVVNEQRSKNPLLPLSIFRVKGLAAADITQLIGIAGMFAVFFFLTLYVQDILGYSPIRTGLAYLPVTAGVGVPPQTAGLAAALFNASQWIGGALGLVIFSAIATARTYLLAAHAAPVAPWRTSDRRAARGPDPNGPALPQSSGLKGRRVPGLIDRKLRAVRQADGREQPPALIGDVPGHFDSLASQLGQGGLDVVTHEIELVMALTLGWMNRELSRRQSEDEPAASRVCRWHTEHVSEERADLLGLFREDDRMDSGDHGAILASGGAGHRYDAESAGQA